MGYIAEFNEQENENAFVVDFTQSDKVDPEKKEDKGEDDGLENKPEGKEKAS